MRHSTRRDTWRDMVQHSADFSIGHL